MSQALNAKPRVSVVMCAFNAGPFLAPAIKSILSQTYSNYEFIILDDGSTDNTAAIIENYDDARIIQLKNADNIGLTRSLNLALKEAQGELIARQDADDVSLPERLERQLDYLDRHPEISLLGTAWDQIYNDGRRDGPHLMPENDTAIRWKLLFDQAFCHTTVMFRRQLLGGGPPWYDESLPCSQDFELWSSWMMRALCARVRGANLQEPLALFRIHDQRISAQRREEQQRIADLIVQNNIRALDPAMTLSSDDVGRLRKLYYLFPEPFNEKDVELCRTFLRLFVAFSKVQEANAAAVEELRRHLIFRIKRGIPPEWRARVLAGALGEYFFNPEFD